ncbi:MAG: TPRREGION domain-containing protein [Nitrospira sp.]|nr:MAG: TPRREGION domain-containing protein [Nitrospira sp.]
MGRAGRCAGSVVALCGLLLAVACGDASIDAYCEANGKGNQETLKLLTHVLEQKRNQTGIYLARARCFYFLGSYAQALQDASEVIRRVPNKADAYLIRAKASKMLGQIPQALDDYSMSIRLRPGAEAHYGRGLIYVREHQGKDREALDDFTAAIRFDPKHVGAYKARAEIYSRHENFQLALQDSEIVLKLDPATPNAYCNVGFAHYALGHDAEGRKLLTVCYQKDPDPQTRGYYETEVRKVLVARQPKRNSGGSYVAEGGVKTPYNREMERQQNVYESLRNSGFNDRAEACRMDGSKC